MLTFGAGAAAITAAALTGKPERVVRPGAGGTGEHRGYRLTRHIEDYYRTARV